MGSGTYNRFEALSPGPRVFTIGKRLLSDDKAEGSAPKMPRIDHNKIFDQLKEHNNSMETARAGLTAANAVIAAHCKPDDGGVGTAFHNLSAARASILKGNEILKSAVLDS